MSPQPPRDDAAALLMRSVRGQAKREPLTADQFRAQAKAKQEELLERYLDGPDRLDDYSLSDLFRDYADWLVAR
jgi:hypothetical protein